MSNPCDARNVCPIYQMYDRLHSSEAGRHLLNARKEILMAVKSLIEKEIERTDKTGQSKRAKKVKIG